MRGHARYFIRCDTDQRICGEYNRFVGRANSIKSAKAIISKFKKENEYNPSNFKIYDSYAEVDKNTNFVPCVYEEV